MKEEEGYTTSKTAGGVGVSLKARGKSSSYLTCTPSISFVPPLLTLTSLLCSYFMLKSWPRKPLLAQVLPYLFI